MKPLNGSAPQAEDPRERFARELAGVLGHLGIRVVNMEGDGTGLRITYQREGSLEVHRCGVNMVAIEQRFAAVPALLLPVAVCKVVEHADGDGQPKLEGVPAGHCFWCGAPLGAEPQAMQVTEIDGERRGVLMHDRCAELHGFAAVARPQCEACGVALESRPRGPGGKAAPGCMYCPKCGGAYRVDGAQG